MDTAAAAGPEMTTKELCEATGISEATLRRWLRDGQPVPELADAKRDWRRWRQWEDRHVQAIQRYQQQKQVGTPEAAEAARQLKLPLNNGRKPRGGE